MKRRDFLKLPAAALAVVALPALAKPDNSIVFDGRSDYLKVDTFALNEPVTIYHLHKQVAWSNITPKDTIVYNRLLTDEEHKKVVSYMGHVRIYEGEKSKMIIPRPLPPGARAKEISGAH